MRLHPSPTGCYGHDVGKDTWVDQANTCWTGTELAFAGLLIQEGLVDEGVKVIRNVDDRYRRWGMYWDHQEFGGHYYRPMSAWGLVNALAGLSLMDGVITFDPKVTERPSRLLWVTPDGYGHLELRAESVAVRVLSGQLKARELRFARPCDGRRAWTLRLGRRVVPARVEGRSLVVRLEGGLTVPEGDRLTLEGHYTGRHP